MLIPSDISNNKELLTDVFRKAFRLSKMNGPLNGLLNKNITSEKLRADMGTMADEARITALDEMLTHSNNLAAIYSKVGMDVEGMDLTDEEHQKLQNALNYFTDGNFRNTRDMLNTLLKKADLRTLEKDNPALYTLAEMSRSLASFDSALRQVVVSKTLDLSEQAIKNTDTKLEILESDENSVSEYAKQIGHSFSGGRYLLIYTFDDMQKGVEEYEQQFQKYAQVQRELESVKKTIIAAENLISGAVYKDQQKLEQLQGLIDNFDKAGNPLKTPKDRNNLLGKIETATKEISDAENAQLQGKSEQKAIEEEIENQKSVRSSFQGTQKKLLETYTAEHIPPAEEALKEARAEAARLSKEVADLKSQIRQVRGSGNRVDEKLTHLFRFVERMSQDPTYVDMAINAKEVKDAGGFAEANGWMEIRDGLQAFAAELGMDEETQKDFFQDGWDRKGGMGDFAEKMAPWIQEQIGRSPERAEKAEILAAELELELENKDAEYDEAYVRQQQAEQTLENAKKSVTEYQQKQAGNPRLIVLNQNIQKTEERLEAKKLENSKIAKNLANKKEQLTTLNKDLQELDEQWLSDINKFLVDNGADKISAPPSSENDAKALLKQVHTQKDNIIKNELKKPEYTAQMQLFPKAVLADAEKIEQELREKEQAESAKIALMQIELGKGDKYEIDEKTGKKKLVKAENGNRNNMKEMDPKQQLTNFKNLIERYNDYCDSNNTAIDVLQKADELKAAAKDAYGLLGDGLIGQLQNVSEHLEDKRRLLHSDSTEFAELKKALNDLVNPGAASGSRKKYDDDDPLLGIHLLQEAEQSDANQPEEDKLTKIQRLNNAARAYIAAKEAQTRNSPSEMRISRLNAAREIEQSTAMYLAQRELIDGFATRVEKIKSFNSSKYVLTKQYRIEKVLLEATAADRQKAIDVACAEARGKQLDEETKLWADEHRQLIDASQLDAQKRIKDEDQQELEKGKDIVKNYLKNNKSSKAEAEWIRKNLGKARDAFQSVLSDMNIENENTLNTYSAVMIQAMERYIRSLNALASVPEEQRQLPQNPTEDAKERFELMEKQKAHKIAYAMEAGKELDPEERTWANKHRDLVNDAHERHMEYDAKKAKSVVKNYLENNNKSSEEDAEWIREHPGKTRDAFKEAKLAMEAKNQEKPGSYPKTMITSIDKYIQTLSNLADKQTSAGKAEANAEKDLIEVEQDAQALEKAYNIAYAVEEGMELDKDAQAWAKEHQDLIDDARESIMEFEANKARGMVARYLENNNKSSAEEAEWVRKHPEMTRDAFQEVKSMMEEENRVKPGTHPQKTINSIDKYIQTLSKLADKQKQNAQLKNEKKPRIAAKSELGIGGSASVDTGVHI